MKHATEIQELHFAAIRRDSSVLVAENHYSIRLGHLGRKQPCGSSAIQEGSELNQNTAALLLALLLS